MTSSLVVVQFIAQAVRMPGAYGLSNVHLDLTDTIDRENINVRCSGFNIYVKIILILLKRETGYVL